MTKFIKTRDGSEVQYGPRLVGDILNEMFSSNEPLATSIRQLLPDAFGDVDAEDDGDDQLFKTIYPNTELGVDLKLFTRTPGRLMIGKDYSGVLARDEEYHYTFVEIPGCSFSHKRNPHVFEGRYITVTRRDDGTYRLNFRPVKMGRRFSIDRYAAGVSGEIRKALKGLVGEGKK